MTLKLILILAGVIYLIYRRFERHFPNGFRRDGFFTTH